VPIATGLALGIGAGVAAAGSVGAAAIGSHAAGEAASTQSDAAKYAADLQKQQADKALAFQQQQWNTQQQNLAPWLSSGQTSLANLNSLLGLGPNYTGSGPMQPTSTPPGPTGAPVRPSSGAIAGQADLPAGSDPTRPGAPVQTPSANAYAQPMRGFNDVGAMPNRTALPGAPPTTAATYDPSKLVNPSLGGFGSLSKGWDQTFQAPTNVTEQNDPGYKFRLDQGMQALQNSAAARGDLLSGGTAKALTNYGQDYASNEYGNVYNRALGQYQQNYNQYQQNQTNQFNRFASLAGLGQTTAAQLGQFGQQAATNYGNIALTSGAQQGQQANNAAAATASGYVGGANAWGGALNNLSGLAQLPLYSQMLQNQQNQQGPNTGGA
jgi:hypothetical protein